MNRRYFLYTSAIGFVSGLSGCQRSNRTRPTTTKKSFTKHLRLSPAVSETANGWQLKVIVRNVHDWHTSIHDIQVLAYAANGSKVCEAQVGDLLKTGDFKRTVEMTCSAFPIIITATSRETACEDALIPVLRWIGTDAQRKSTVTSDKQAWKSTYRKCGEDLLPQRVLDKVETSTKENE